MWPEFYHGGLFIGITTLAALIHYGGVADRASYAHSNHAESQHNRPMVALVDLISPCGERHGPFDLP